MNSAKFDKNRKNQLEQNQNWRNMEGTIVVPLTNDYLFKALAQTDKEALMDLICATVHIPKEEIRSLEVTNPIELGKAIDEKLFILDVKLILNNNTLINLEMQVIDYGDWPERSLQYLCRTYDSLLVGDNYLDSKTAIQVSILNYRLFGKESVLHESYRLMNVRTHKVYTDRLQLYVICLPCTASVTEEDKNFHTDLWAKFFKAKTWEELKMLANESQAIESAASTIHELIAQQNIRDQIFAREEFHRMQKRQLMEKEAAVTRAEEEKQRAEEEKQRADEEKKRADKEEQRANNLDKQLKDSRAEIERLKKIISESASGM